MAGFLTTLPIIFFNMAVISTIDPRSVFKSIAFDVLNLIFLCHGYLLMHLVFLIRIRLMALNASLLVETERLKSISEMVWVVPNRSDKSAVDNILKLLGSYRLIQKLALTYNNRYSVDMLLIVMTSVVYLVLIPTRFPEPNKILTISRSILEFLVHMGRLLMIAESCYRCSREVMLVGCLKR
ncbi:uncharacterized protein LOC132706145 [Cylas formicarius]|uniref:uncharacterized protein LOC132706145 n=1 Tax=Cylas formicarius TaxID=197179 RepID=UPI002958DE43|nr:uncharacterized protein LOC132706145 [Cylas formicarius]